jgi:hypothetical protein
MFAYHAPDMKNVRPIWSYVDYDEEPADQDTITITGVTPPTPGPNNCIIISGGSDADSPPTFDLATYGGNDVEEQVEASGQPAASTIGIHRYTSVNQTVVWGHTGVNFTSSICYIYHVEGVHDPRHFAGSDSTVNGASDRTVQWDTFFDDYGEQFDCSVAICSIFCSGTNGNADVPDHGIGGTLYSHDKNWDITNRDATQGGDCVTLASMMDIWEMDPSMNLIASNGLASNNNNLCSGCIGVIK